MKPRKSPDVQDDREGDEKEGIGRRSGVPGRRGGEGGGGGLMEGGGLVGRAGCLLLFKRQWVLCAD